MDDIDSLAKILWNYNVLNQKVEKADCIIALGNSDIRTAQKAADLYLKGYGDLLITTGGYGRLTKDHFTKPEAQIFADEAMALGVPEDKIIIEDSSTNTFDNIRFTKNILGKRGLNPISVLLVTKPYMERRAFTSVQAEWSDIKLTVTSPSLDFDTYPNESISRELLINMIVGDTQRLMIFSKYKLISEQVFPDQVLSAYHRLVELGYTQQIIPEVNIPSLLRAVSSGRLRAVSGDGDEDDVKH